MKSCPVCQADLNRDESRCPVCDSDLKTVIEMERYLDVAGARQAPERRAARGYGWLLLLLPILILFAAAGWFAHQLSGRYPKPQAAARTGGPPAFRSEAEAARGALRPESAVKPLPAAQVPRIERIRPIAVESREPPETAAPLAGRGDSRLAENREILFRLAARINQKMPPGASADARKGGIFVEGAVDYPWQKRDIERMSESWQCDFVDLTGLKIEHPDAVQYRVRRGDNLSTLAGLFLGSPSVWPVLYEANRKVLNDPDRLEIGQQIVVLTRMPAGEHAD